MPTAVVAVRIRGIGYGTMDGREDISSFRIRLPFHAHLPLDASASHLDFLQKSARQFTNPPSHTANESSEHEILESYIRGLLFAVAIWHAQAMLSMVQENVGMPEDISKRTATSTSSRPMSEPPRLPYCIYFSTLIAWYGEFENSGYRSLARDACIKQGIRILGRLKKRVARVFILALRELLPDERWPGAACLIHEMYHLSCGALYSRDYTVV